MVTCYGDMDPSVQPTCVLLQVTFCRSLQSYAISWKRYGHQDRKRLSSGNEIEADFGFEPTKSCHILIRFRRELGAIIVTMTIKA